MCVVRYARVFLLSFLRRGGHAASQPAIFQWHRTEARKSGRHWKARNRGPYKTDRESAIARFAQTRGLSEVQRKDRLQAGRKCVSAKVLATRLLASRLCLKTGVGRSPSAVCAVNSFPFARLDRVGEATAKETRLVDAHDGA